MKHLTDTNEEVFQENAPAGKKRVSGRIFAIGAVLLAVGLLGGFLIGYFSVDARARNLGRMVDKVANNYYQDVDKDDLYDRLYDALELDRFCTHYTPDEYAQVRSESEGYNSGYGISFSSAESGSRVYRTVGNSPAELAGIRSGMYVTRFGTSAGTLIEGTRAELLAFLGENNSCVLACGYEEDGSDAQLYPVTRGGYAASYCVYADSDATFRFRGENTLTLTQTQEGGMSALDADTAYIRLTEFDGRAAEEFEDCLKLMKKRGKSNLIIDLRSNGGGYLSILCEIAAHLLKNAEGKSPLVATARYRNGSESRYRAKGNDFDVYFNENSRIRVLADENTASASESLIGAMLDYGTISYDDIYLRVNGDGTARTFGKGVMQSTFTVADGNALRLTVAEIFWPKGNSIHGRGVTSDDGAHAVEAPLLPSTEDMFLNQVL